MHMPVGIDHLVSEGDLKHSTTKDILFYDDIKYILGKILTLEKLEHSLHVCLKNENINGKNSWNFIFCQ